MPAGPQLAATKWHCSVRRSPSGSSGRKQRFCACQPSRASAGTRPTESSTRAVFQCICQLAPPPGQAGRKAIRTSCCGTKLVCKNVCQYRIFTAQPQAQFRLQLQIAKHNIVRPLWWCSASSLEMNQSHTVRVKPVTIIGIAIIVLLDKVKEE